MAASLRKKIYLLITIILPGLLLVPPIADFHPSFMGCRHEHGAARAAEEETLYTCSMHPFIIQKEPGQCPICGMDLVPLRRSGGRKEDEASSGIITIDPATQQNMGVRTAVVTRRNLSRTIRTVGIVGYDEPRQYSVNTKTDGWIEKLYVNQTGESVRQGQPLLDIYSPDLVAAQQEFLLAVHNNAVLAANPFPEIAKGAENLLKAARKRLEYWDISQEQINALEKNDEINKTLTLYAGNSGVVTRKAVNEGAFVKAGTELFQLSDISHVWIYADIYEYELPWVKEGQEAHVYFPYPRPPIHGRIATIYPYVEARTRTVKARIDVNNADLALKPDMYVNVVLEGQGAKDALTVPSEAVLRSGQRETVFVAVGDGRFDPRPVKTGLESDDGYFQIIEGLHEGEKIVTSAQFMLDSESKLREAVHKFMPATPDAAPTKAPGPAAPTQGELDDLFK